MRSTDIIFVENLRKEFKVKVRQSFLKDLFKPKWETVEALKNISFRIKEGNIVGFLGPNGAGKSTTVKILIGILFPTSGEVIVDGFIPWKQRKDLARKIGVVFGQRRFLWYTLSLKDNLEMVGAIYGLSRREVEERIKELDDILGIREFLNYPYRKLSLGQQMKGELAAAMIHNPKILFLDEPTVGIDLISRLQLLDFLKKISKEEKKTILYTSHDLWEVEKICKRIIIINKGAIVYDGDLDKIRPNKIIVEAITEDEKVIRKEVPRKDIKRILEELPENIVDVKFHEIPIEEIIKEFYTK